MHCQACGKPVLNSAVICPSCGSSPHGAGVNAAKSRMAAGLLNLICLVGLPIGGIGRLYLGYIGIGIAQLLLSFLCIGYIWSVIDGILILTGSPATDAEGKPLSS